MLFCYQVVVAAAAVLPASVRSLPRQIGRRLGPRPDDVSRPADVRRLDDVGRLGPRFDR